MVTGQELLDLVCNLDARIEDVEREVKFWRGQKARMAIMRVLYEEGVPNAERLTKLIEDKLRWAGIL